MIGRPQKSSDWQHEPNTEGGWYSRGGTVSSHRPEKDMPTRPERERLVSVPDTTASGVPRTALQALMEAAPHQEPAMSLEELADVPTPALDALDLLDESDRELVLMYVFGRMSYERIKDDVGQDWRMQTKRSVDAALNRVRMIMENTTQEELELAS